MTRQLLDGTDIGSGIQRVTDEGAPKIVRGERWHLGLLPPQPENVQHRLIAHPSGTNPTALHGGME